MNFLQKRKESWLRVSTVAPESLGYDLDLATSGSWDPSQLVGASVSSSTQWDLSPRTVLRIKDKETIDNALRTVSGTQWTPDTC